MHDSEVLAYEKAELERYKELEKSDPKYSYEARIKQSVVDWLEGKEET